MDLTLYRVTRSGDTDLIGRRPPPRHGPHDRFLKGPIPWAWIVRAANLPGKTLHVSLTLWHKAFMLGCRTVKLSYSELDSMGCKRECARRALMHLENARLVSVKRHAGRSPVITILEARGSADFALARTPRYGPPGYAR